MKVDGPPREQGRSTRTWIKVVKIDMKKFNLFEDLAQDRSEWKNKIRVTDPNIVLLGNFYKHLVGNVNLQRQSLTKCYGSATKANIH